ncbi:alkaline phosphatase family protein [Granulicella mallensis]|uniref:Putative AlkP superfamily pyrophosphatase or phosphodiesterase n=1 Tax=Granulicella mallensis TaxID=940614 RepID=A0A7W8E7S7_9BACT|nr:alkaline phosphatase family protein [Granulicella mallensis]MBB5062613.1 putative AlkP superfamily pyrophosphatase or phosphodiesterase [Granulicella mallensis]
MFIRTHQSASSRLYSNFSLYFRSAARLSQKTYQGVAFLLACWISTCSVLPAQQQAKQDSAEDKHPPKLILQIVVDQLREDMLSRMAPRFGKGGFRYLMDEGVWYVSATHPHANTETAVGHTVLATGAYPSRNGIIGNKWLDPKTGKVQDCVNNLDYFLVGTQKTSAAPLQILTTTFSDQMALATNGKSHIFAVSEKDRAAIPLAGHNGKAFWFNTDNGQFNTSTYYYSAYPAWVSDWNNKKDADAWQNKEWVPLDKPTTYLYYGTGPFAKNMGPYGDAFPHHFGTLGGDGTFYTKLTISYVGNRLTADFAKALIENEQLGSHEGTDYLGISFSSTDIVDHNFSPDSMEGEDVLLRLDQTLACLFSYIDKTVGLKNTLIVLAGDHGSADVPEYLETLHIPTGRLDTTIDDLVTAVNQVLLDKYQVPNLLFPSHQPLPYLYLDHDLIQKNHLDLVEVQRTAADAVMSKKGIYLALPATSTQTNNSNGDAQLLERIQRMHNPARAGDLYVVQLPQWQLGRPPASGEGNLPGAGVDHGSPWEYDTSVPVIFAGARLKHSVISRPISTVDVAVTLSGKLGIGYPSGSAGTVLPEIVPAAMACQDMADEEHCK